MSSSVIFQKVAKKYKMYRKKSDKLLDIALPKNYGKDFYALQNISFTAEQGDVIGVIGINGSGKSTLSNLIAGVIPPTVGEIKINGEVSIISIASGLNNQLTGRDNIELKCLMLGFSKQEIKKLMPEIIDFAELGDFIDQPVKSYSSGMKSRLGFAISVTIDPDILVVDEALSVGDKTFADKSLAKMIEFKERGKTIFFISHSIAQVKQFCDKALWLEAGEIKAFGSAAEVIPQYEKFVNGFRKLSKEEQEKIKKDFDERRSKFHHVVEEDKQDDNIELPPTMTKRKRKKTKFWLISLLFALILTTGIVLSWDKFSTFNQSEPPEIIEPEVIVENENAKINNETVEEEPEIIEQLDIRYVNVSAAFVRDMPDLEASNQLSMVYFGQPILVLEEKEDPNGEMNWLKFKIQDNQELWISDGVVTKVDQLVNEEELILTVESQFNIDLSNLNALFATDAETLMEEESSIYIFDRDGNLSELSYSLNNTAMDKLIDQLGEPQLSSDEQTVVVYHGENYDYFFSAVNSNQMNSLIVRPVIKEKNAVIELNLFEGDVESVETRGGTQTESNTPSPSNQTEQITTRPSSPTLGGGNNSPPLTKPVPPTKEPEKPKDQTSPKQEEPKQQEKPTNPTPKPSPDPDPIVPPENPGVPEEPTPDPTTPSEP